MATKNKPGRFDCYANAHPDEPMFVLLGRDPMAGSLVRQWASWRERIGEDPAKVAEARECADALDVWAVALKKVPMLNPIDVVVHEASCMTEYAADCGLCAICDGYVPGAEHDGATAPCDDDCPGWSLRAALALV
jgi:hypothetical protein